MSKKYASELSCQTYEASVYCGTWCQGGQVTFDETTTPEWTNIQDVWVKGSDYASLEAKNAELLAALVEAKSDIVRLANAGVEKLNMIAPQIGWDAGTVVAEIYTRKIDGVIERNSK